MLEVFLLGQFNIQIDGQRVELPSRPAQSLLAHLALTAGVAHRREKLAGLLWPDAPEADARRNLRRALWQIRKALEAQTPLRADDITVAFVAGPNVWVDALAVTQKLSPERTKDELTRAVAAYGGELLPGFFDEWVSVERERLQATFESRIKLLLGRLVEAGQWDEVLEWGEHWIALSPGAEPAYRALMTAYAGLGDLAGMAHTYQRCVETLERDLGVEPSDATRVLYNQLSQKKSVQIISHQLLTLENQPGEKAKNQLREGAAANDQPAGELPEPNGQATLAEESPFKGLQFFEESDAGLFFGREEITQHLLARLGLADQLSGTPENLLVIVGASGSGKSSLARAGLVPAVRRLPGWEIAIITPSTHPLENLATALTRDADSVRPAAALADDMAKDARSLRLFLQRRPKGLFLVVDQLEELFTLCTMGDKRRAFVDNLLAAAEGERCKVVLTLRADFYAHCAMLENMRAALAYHQEYIGPMNTAELRRAMEEPAQSCGYIYEAGLVDLILRDVGGEPGSLPLLSHALLETWKRRKGRSLALAGYTEAGGVHGAIAHTAQGVYDRLPPTEQRIARDIFLRLTELGEGVGPGGLPAPDTRRRVSLQELVHNSSDPDCVAEVLNFLADARLVTVSQDAVEVAHEALIREWPTLRAWLAEDRDGLRLHRRVTEAALSWEAQKRDPSELFRGARLALVAEWAAAHPDALHGLDLDFLQASQAAAEAETTEREAARERELAAARKLAEAELLRAEEQERSAQRFSWLAAGLAVLLLVAVLFANSYLQQRNLSANQAGLATSRELAASAISSLQVDPERSILLGLQALQTADTQEAESALHQAVQASRVNRVIHTHNPWAIRMAVSPDGQRQVVTSITQQGDFVTEVWDLGTDQLLLTLPGGLAADFWPDSRKLATVSAGPGGKEVITFWDARTGQVLSTVQRDRLFPQETLNGNFSPDWSLVAEAFKDGTTTVSRLDTGETLLSLGKAGDPPGGLVQFSPDGKRLLALVENTVRIWDITTGQVVATLPSADVGITAAAFSPKKDQVALGIGSLVKIVDASTGQTLLTLSGHTGFVQGLRYHPSGSVLLSVGADSQAILWDANSGQMLLRLAGHTAAIESMGFIPGSNLLATSSLDGSVRIWDGSQTGNAEGVSAFDFFQKMYTGIAFSPDGKRLAVSGGSSTGEILDSATGQSQFSLPGNAISWQGSLAFNPDGTQLAITSGANEAEIWDVIHQKKLQVLSGHQAWISHLAYSPDGKRIATIAFDGKAKVWEAATGKEIFSVTAFTEALDTSQLLGVAFSPDGKRFVTAGGRTPRVWDAASGKNVLVLPAQEENVYTAAFSPDGKRLALGLALGSGANIWDLQSGKQIAQLIGHQGSVQAILFSPDGKQVLTGSVDGTIKVWDASTGLEELTLTRQSAQITGLALSTDGRRLAASASDGTARVYLLEVSDLVQYALRRLTRWFTPEECTKYLHTTTCPLRP